MSTAPLAEDGDALLLRGGRRAWAVLGVVGVLVLLYLLLREVSILATPLVVAMFPAAVLSPAAWLHPFAVILAVSAGAVTYGVLGAFLGVPLAACAGRVVDYLRGRRPAAGPGSDPADDEPARGEHGTEHPDTDGRPTAPDDGGGTSARSSGRATHAGGRPD